MYSGGIEHPYKDGIIFVSNRGPFKIVDDKYVLTKGGLVSATLGLMKDGKSSWITASEEVGKNPVYHHNGDGYNFTWKTVHTSEEIIESYYENICNSFLWPVCHYSEDILRSRTFPKITGSFNISDYDDYFQTNRNFAQAVKREYEFSPRPIWIQDYHFLPAPRLVRRGLKPIVNGSVRDVPIGFFMHPPFISKYARDLLNSNELWKHYDNESPRKDIALGMLGADLIGFHVPEYVNDCVDFITEAVPGIKVDRDSKYVIITHEKDGKRNETYIGAFPIGLEIEKILESSKLENGCDHNSEYLDMDNLIKRRKSQGVTVICGLGRMDYTKGILESLEIMEEMLTRGENVQYIGYWCPSR
ncbi:MAG: trehalose-6-phosphate synthase [Candidatus Aenigmarchaeota archaeon]|nr:trehalose-6-phosphate synthase [Candidatus Aenigmarchaeota archaeon]